MRRANCRAKLGSVEKLCITCKVIYGGCRMPDRTALDKRRLPKSSGTRAFRKCFGRTGPWFRRLCKR